MRHRTIKIVLSAAVPLTLFNFAKGQLAFLKKTGFEVSALCSPGKELEEIAKREGIETFAIQISREIKPSKDLISLFKLLHLFHGIKPTIVQAGTPKAALLSLTAAFILRVPVRVFLLHGLRSEGLNGWKKTMIKWTECCCCCFAHQVLSVSESVRTLVINEKICKPDKIKVLHNGTANGIDSRHFDPNRFSEGYRERVRRNISIPNGAKVLLFAGRLVRDKGIVELYNAWEILKEEYADVYLVIAGCEEAGDPAPRHVMAALKQDQRVRMLDYVEDIVSYYAAASLLILPTYREGFPYVPMEAAAMALPVVATKVTGCLDAVVDGVTGTLVPPRDVNALVHAIEVYLNDEQLRKNHGKAGRDRIVRDFQPGDLWKAYHDEYLRLLKLKGYF